MKVLLTGFELDDACPYNSSFEIIQKINPRSDALEIVTDVIRCDYRNPIGVVRDLAEKHHPDVFICMGQALRREVISLEKVAINYQHDARTAAAGGCDYYGFVPRNRAVVPGGPDVLFSTLPLQQMLKTAEEHHIPCEISLTAGAVGCNNAMYSVLYYALTEHPGMMGGFIHVPANHEHPRRLLKSYSTQYLADSIETILQGLISID